MHLCNNKNLYVSKANKLKISQKIYENMTWSWEHDLNAYKIYLIFNIAKVLHYYKQFIIIQRILHSGAQKFLFYNDIIVVYNI